MINSKRGSFGPFPSQNMSLLLDKNKSHVRRSTPDSEALASSDDEQDHAQRTIASSAQYTPKSNRRPSWLSETRPPMARKTSGSALESLSTNLPNASDDTSTWSAGGSRGHAGSASLPWSNAIWGSDGQKGLPTRLSEVLSSPTSLSQSSAGNDVPLKSPSPRRDSMSDAAIPFAIPLQPTLKSYRSQSYSVGQLDSDNANPSTTRPGQSAYAGRTRAGSSYAGIQHRPSRPSVLGEFSAESSGLGQVQEVEDDEEGAAGLESDFHYANSQARTIEQLARENAILRQQALANQSASAQAAMNAYGMGAPGLRGHRGLQINESVLEESDDQLANNEDFRPRSNSGSIGARHHRFNGSQETLQSTSPEQLIDPISGSRSPVSYKRGQWQSSLGFGGLVEAPQSRRHSFADMPLRSMPSNVAQDVAIKQADLRQAAGVYASPGATISQTENVSYFTNPISRYPELRNPPGSVPSHMGHQQRMPYFGQPQMHQPQSLYLVTFKAARAEFYYVQEGTGLEVNEGDLVIVEADRGTDLGTVAHKNVDWSVAKELKEQYVAEHYNWLMMFSRQGQNGMSQGAARPTSSGGPGSKAPSMGVHAQNSVEGLTAEIKPKMIKRLAQQHEIHTLREKEGNEAKAKRMCQQKVAEHHLNMEILDAEFQMDWKKLTFYYFADSYINFNSLVTDLFKIYKTRIWMSAINPASFVSPATGLSAHVGPGFGAVGLERDQFGDMRNKHEGNFGAPGMQDNGYDSGWPQNAAGGMPSAASAGYAHFWPGQNFQQPQAAGIRGQATRETPSPNSRLGARDTASPRAKGHYTDSMMNSSYLDQMQALQGLSLGGN